MQRIYKSLNPRVLEIKIEEDGETEYRERRDRAKRQEPRV